MKGTLKKDKDKWVVEYKECCSEKGCQNCEGAMAICVMSDKQLPLHPVQEHNYLKYGWLIEGKKVEFELIEICPRMNCECNGSCSNCSGSLDIYNVAKLITSPKQEVKINSFINWLKTRFTPEAPVSYVISEYEKEFKQEESNETWDEIFELYNYSLSTIKDSSPYKLKTWLKERYSPPQKR